MGNEAAIAAAILGAAYLLSRRAEGESAPQLPQLGGAVGPAAPQVLALPAPQLLQLPELNIRVEAPTITLPSLPAPTQVAEAVRDRVERARTYFAGAPPGFSFGDGSPDVPGKLAEVLDGDAGGLLDGLDTDAVLDGAIEVVDDLKERAAAAIADWEAGAAARDLLEAPFLLAEAALEKAQQLANVEAIRERVSGLDVGTVRIDDLRAMVLDPVLELAPGLDDLGVVGDAVQLVQKAEDVLDFVDRTVGPRAWREGIRGYQWWWDNRKSQAAKWLGNTR